ncbi:MAG: ABC transporter substrate-binding protein [Roseitalea sp.]|nr:ABC transporter substrate-binding protein [Roseitalea sp.]MBO6720365.1 ABC transporter substrate-binding protein [Roseitalea sp.]MBO6742725.1 ABC transporter substrate-binding protein [Roseitalea sp.]
MTWHYLSRTVSAVAITAALAGMAHADYSQAPGLEEQVSSGSLPALEERLPATPLVVEAVDAVGTYGGTWRTAMSSRTDSWFYRTVNYDHLVMWNQDWTGVVPNVAESVEANEDATVFTFTLREGHKWSDGTPFTSADAVFAMEMLKDTNLGIPARAWRNAAGWADVEAIDDRTFTVTFGEPYGTFLQDVSRISSSEMGGGMVKLPKHFMSQFHPDYNENAEQLASDAGFDSWADHFNAKWAVSQSPEKPTLSAWIVTEPFGEGSQVRAVRNPYYFKVDTDGNQLPYIDEVLFNVYQDNEVMLLQALAGEMDFHGRHINTVVNRPVLADVAEDIDMEFLRLIASSANEGAIYFNQTFDGPMAEALSNRDFRAGLSHALDREAICDTVFVGAAVPRQIAVSPEFDPLYNEQLANQHLEFDVDLANELLDKAGFSERDGDGFRLLSNGDRVRLIVQVRTDKQDMIDIADLASRYWKEVGVDVQLDVVERSLSDQRRDANQHMLLMEDHSSGLADAILAASPYLPVDDDQGFGIPWFYWYAGMDNAQEPPEQVKRQIALYREMGTRTEPAEQFEVFAEILQITADNFFALGTCSEEVQYSFKLDHMRNVPSVQHGSFAFAPPGPYHPAHFWIDESMR